MRFIHNENNNMNSIPLYNSHDLFVVLYIVEWSAFENDTHLFISRFISRYRLHTVVYYSPLT